MSVFVEKGMSTLWRKNAKGGSSHLEGIHYWNRCEEDHRVRAGRLDRIVTLQRAITAQDAYGEEIKTWVDITDVWAERVELRGEERFIAQQTQARVDAKYRIRWMAGLTPVDRLIDADGKIYDIQACLEIGRHEGLELLVSAKGE